MNMDEKINQILQKAKEEGEVFLTTLTPEELKSTGFEEDSDFFNFSNVDIYIIYDGEYKIKYIFDNDPSNFLYETEKEIGGFTYFLEVINAYLKTSK